MYATFLATFFFFNFFICMYAVVVLPVEDEDVTSTMDALVDAGTQVIVPRIYFYFSVHFIC